MKEMNFIKKDNNGNVVDSQVVRKGYAAYIWLEYIPLVGWLIYLIMSITRKEFKAVWLNKFLVSVAAGAIMGFCLFWADYVVIYFFGAIIHFIINILIGASANYTKAYQLTQLGYEAEVKDADDELFVREAMRRQKPWYQWISFK